MSKNELPIVVYTFLIQSGSILLLRRSNTGFEDGNYGPAGVLALSVVDNSISPAETLKKGGLKRLAAQSGV